MFKPAPAKAMDAAAVHGRPRDASTLILGNYVASPRAFSDSLYLEEKI